MAEITVSDYRTAQDLTATAPYVGSINLPGNLVRDEGQHAILTFRVDATEDCEIWVHLNNSADNPTGSNMSIRLAVRKSEGHKTVHELLGASGLRANWTNKIRIEQKPGSRGRLYVSDIVLQFRKRVTV